ncbi:hypothetical protein RTG_02545 [Rhodotorula toruloides ATCC 204091]|uniref:BHLH domain-containing protein n=1 Tax=Rhodotorula toruloides TaxID=5286 RepID=A0A0K3CMY2_RHOTO|nr:hypothetical protein RTG_02545 [Rhodotorula toruloides ATCC 204091]KAK4330288.1 BHLH domain-containing protein [Rhodotorula toruloides]PRQ70918.1 hypothetical protein AAT19DRAFT_10458 [Rhodotorula toruloides]
MPGTWTRTAARDHSPSLAASSQTPASHTRTTTQRGPATREDDQQISQILAEMSQHPQGGQSASPPPQQPHASTSAALEGIPVGPPETSTTGSSSIDPLLNPLPLPVPPPLPPLTTSPSTSDAKGKGKATATTGGSGAGAGSGAKSRGRGKSDERLQMKEEDWERSRKDNHKEVERKRRETINQGITNLAALLPSELLTQSASPSDSTTSTSKPTSKPPKETTNKSTILSLTQSYILQLKASEQRIIEKWTLEKLLMEQRVREVEGEREGWRKRAELAEAEVKRLRGETSGDAEDGREKKRARVEDGEGAQGKARENGAAEGA